METFPFSARLERNSCLFSDLHSNLVRLKTRCEIPSADPGSAAHGSGFLPPGDLGPFGSQAWGPGQGGPGAQGPLGRAPDRLQPSSRQRRATFLFLQTNRSVIDVMVEVPLELSSKIWVCDDRTWARPWIHWSNHSRRKSLGSHAALIAVRNLMKKPLPLPRRSHVASRMTQSPCSSRQFSPNDARDARQRGAGHQQSFLSNSSKRMCVRFFFWICLSSEKIWTKLESI